MKRLQLALLVPFLATGCYAVQGSGEIVTVNRELTQVREVEVCCGWHVDIVETDDAFVRIIGDDNIVGRIDIEHDGDRLELSYDKDRNYQPTRQIDVRIGVQELRRFEGSGGVELSTSELSTRELTLSLSGGSDASIGTVDLLNLRLEGSGGTNVDIIGGCDHLEADLTGGSTLFAGGLATTLSQLELSGGSFATLRVKDNLQVEASGGSEIVYEGSPTLDLDLSGGSSVHRRR